jgi:hypothetical protein
MLILSIICQVSRAKYCMCEKSVLRPDFFNVTRLRFPPNNINLCYTLLQETTSPKDPRLGNERNYSFIPQKKPVLITYDPSDPQHAGC